MPRPDRFEWGVFWASLVTLVVCMVLPVVLVSGYDVSTTLAGEHAAEVTVGIGVIIRATMRRIIRSGAQNMLRTTFGTASRAMARTATRRVLRFFMQSFFASAAKNARDEDKNAPGRTTKSSAIALLIGFVALGLSFWGVVALSGDEFPSPARGGPAAPLWVLCLLAAAPILLYGLVAQLTARRLGMPFYCATDLDGLLIQAYFTGAGSFLPMTTDFEYQGTKAQRAQLASACLLSLLLTHVVLYGLAVWLDNGLLEFAAAAFLVYCFVYSFPIRPLEGHDVWSYSKLGWACLFAPIMASFLVMLPESLARLL